MTAHRPPRLAEWLLSRRVWPDERSAVLGDLDEQFQEQVASSGTRRAKIWYWREALRLVWGLSCWALRLAWLRGSVTATDDVKYAVRRLRKQPMASAISVLTLACAIGAAAVTWSLVSAVLLDPLQVRKPDRLVRVASRRDTPNGPRTSAGYTYPAYVAMRDTALMPLAAFGAIGSATPLTIQAGGEARPARVMFASHDFLDLIGVRMSLGRFFADADDQRGAPLVGVLSDRMWHREFNADPGVVGRVIRVRDKPVEIVGVVPRSFHGLEVGRTPDLVLALHAIDQIESYPDLFGVRPVLYWVNPVGRLPDGVTVGDMEARLNALQRPPEDKTTFVLTDVETAALSTTSRATVAQFSRLLGTTVVMLLAIGSITVGMLLVLRTEARRGELAMCLALGASRARVGAGVIVEGVLLAGAGALAALPVSRVLFAGIRTFQLPGGIGVDRLDLAIDTRVLAGAAAAAFASVLLMAAVASVFGLRRSLDDALRSHSGATPRLSSRRSRSALVTVQVAVTLVLVTGAGLFGRSVVRALSLNPGIDTSRLFSTDLPLPGYGYNPSQEMVFVDSLRDRLVHQPAIASVGVSAQWMGSSQFRFDGEPRDLPSLPPTWIDTQYMSTIGLPMSAGRTFTNADRAGAPLVAIVTSALAKALSGDGSPVGHRIEAGAGLRFSAQIVGVIPDFAWGPRGLKPLGVYLPLAQAPPLPTYPGAPGPSLLVRATNDVPTAVTALTASIRALDPQIRLRPIGSIDDGILDTMAPQRFGMTVMGALGAIALLLSVFGTYVLAESMGTIRRREMGIRAALGAPGAHLRMLLLSETFRLIAAGLLLGFGLSWLGASTIRAFLFQVEPFDPLVTGSVAALIVVLAVLVTLRPALSAARVDLSQVLRED